MWGVWELISVAMAIEPKDETQIHQWDGHRWDALHMSPIVLAIIDSVCTHFECV
jgi:hypothetical protein